MVTLSLVLKEMAELGIQIAEENMKSCQHEECCHGVVL